MFRLLPRLARGRLPGRCHVALQQSRGIFGLGEIAGVLANPAETVRQIKESKEMLEKAKEDNKLAQESKRIPKKHTFSKLPGFHGRKAEQAMLRKVLAGNPQLNVIFGATSVGKTALLREVLATDDFFVIKFDLRISGFADLRSLYYALCEQFQSVFIEMKDDEMEKLSIAFKHLMLDMDEKPQEYVVSVADIAGLMETLQSCLLRYLEYDPKAKAKEEKDDVEDRADGEEEHSRTPPARKVNAEVAEEPSDRSESLLENGEQDSADMENMIFEKKPLVFLLDESHKLSALIDDQLSLKVILDTLLVLTKQDRLCHVVLSTSDPFFQHFLRSMNVGHHSHIISIGDCTEEESLSYIREQILPTVPDELRSRLDVKGIYDAFGGKLSHIGDYISFWVNAGGDTTPYQSAIFTQAYTLLQLHLTHESFETYDPLTTSTATIDGSDQTQFSRQDLLRVMRHLVKAPYSLPYFQLCREIGTAQTDAMIKTRVLELRWTKTVSPEQDWIERVWSKDGVERPIVLPMTRIVRRAMEVCLQEEDERSAMEHEAALKGEQQEPEGASKT